KTDEAVESCRRAGEKGHPQAAALRGAVAGDRRLLEDHVVGNQGEPAADLSGVVAGHGNVVEPQGVRVAKAAAVDAGLVVGDGAVAEGCRPGGDASTAVVRTVAGDVAGHQGQLFGVDRSPVASVPRRHHTGVAVAHGDAVDFQQALDKAVEDAIDPAA